jgi:hypothetical protein
LVRDERDSMIILSPLLSIIVSCQLSPPGGWHIYVP